MYYILHCVQLIYSALLPLISIAQQLFRKEKKTSAAKKQTENCSLLGRNHLQFFITALCVGEKTNKQTRSEWEEMAESGQGLADGKRWHWQVWFLECLCVSL